MTNDDLARKVRGVAASIEDVARVVRSAPLSPSAEEWLELNAQIGRAFSRFNSRRKLVNNSLDLSSPQQRILRYLLIHLNERVDKSELSGVAGIHDWARRIRELRVEHGWLIASDKTRDDLRPGEYMLMSDVADQQKAEDWRLAKHMRNLKKASGRDESGKAKLLAYFKAIQPRSATKDQVAYVAKISSGPRRIRELEEEGWQILSSHDDSSLSPGEYRLATLEQLPPRARKAIKLRNQIFERDGYRCQDCGRSSKTDKIQLQAHHVDGIPFHNESDNLTTLCPDCHSGRHAQMRGVDIASTTDELKNPGTGAEAARP